jgi:hypothetical protein
MKCANKNKLLFTKVQEKAAEKYIFEPLSLDLAHLGYEEKNLR